jgi:hypothetical protein
MMETPSMAKGFESHSRRQTSGFIQRCYKRDRPTFPKGEFQLMPFQNHTKYRRQNPDTNLHCVLSTSVTEQDLERKIETITRYQKPYTKKIFTEMARANSENVVVLYNYIVAQKNELNIKDSTIGSIVKKLVWLSSYLDHKSFSDMTKDDILGYLNSIKKPPEVDPTHKSIGTYNGRQMVFSSFFRWLYNANESDYKRG